MCVCVCVCVCVWKDKRIGFILFGWVGFYGLSNLVGYLILNPFYTYIKCMNSKHIFFITF